MKYVLIAFVFLLVFCFYMYQNNRNESQCTLLDNVKYASRLSIDDIRSLKMSQAKMTNLLREFDRICRKHQLKYWVLDGTLLGSVRHGGWIPWDADVDTMMLKDDYEKLQNIIQSELPEDMWFQDATTDSRYTLGLGKIRNLNSCYIGDTNLSHHNGLQLDIFVGVSKNDMIFDQENRPFKESDIFPLKVMLFEDIEVYVPNNSDAVLTSLYGDYMTLPEIDERIFHEGENSGKIWHNKTCPHHLDTYPQLYKNRSKNSLNYL